MTDEQKELHERCRYGLSDPTTFEHILREYDALRKKTEVCETCSLIGFCTLPPFVKDIFLLRRKEVIRHSIKTFGCNHWEAKQ